jgi:hypothetical protein
MTGNNDANKPKAEMVYNPDKPNMERLSTLAAELVKIVKKYDPSRPVLVASAFPELSSKLGFFDALDLAGYNYKEQYYESDHKHFPRLPIIGSENGHQLSAWKAVADNEFISGQFLWTGIDYLGEAKGWPVHGSGAGLLDMAGNEKPAYFRRKALWNDEPVLYLATALHDDEPRRIWNYAPGLTVTVRCYTNLPTAELFCNGRSFGIQSRSADGELMWEVPFERGRLEVKGVDTDISDSLESTLPAVRLALRQWSAAGKNECAAAKTTEAVDGYTIAQIECEVLDAENRLCVGESPLVHVSIAGQAKLLGIENGDLADCTEYAASFRRAFGGRLIIYALIPPEAKTVAELTARAEGFSDAVIPLHMLRLCSATKQDSP